MAATAFLPYTIGKSDISFVEEYNITYDSDTIIGFSVIEADEIAVRQDSNTAIAKSIIAAEEEFVPFALVENNSYEIEWEEERRFADLYSQIRGAAQISFEEEVRHDPLYLVQFSSKIYANGEFESSEYAEYALFASIFAHAEVGNPKRLQITRSTKRYKDKAVVTGIAWNDPYLIPGIQEEVFYSSGSISAGASFSHDYSIGLGCNRGTLGVNEALSVYQGNLIGNSSMSIGLTVVSPIAYPDSGIVAGRTEIDTDELLYNGRVVGKAQILSGNSIAPQASELFRPAAWKSIVTYASGANVAYNGYIYTSLQNSNTGNTPDSEPTYWAVGDKLPPPGPYYMVVGVGIPRIVNEPVITFSPNIWAIEEYRPDYFGANLIFGYSQVENGPTGPTGATIDIDGVSSTTLAPGFNVLHRVAGTPAGVASIHLNPSFNNDRTRYGGGGYPPGIYQQGSYWTPRGGEPDTPTGPTGSGYYSRTLGGYVIGVASFNHGVGQGELTIA